MKRPHDPRLLLLAGVILALAQVPFLTAWLTAPDGQVFSGILYGHGDGFSYFAKMREGWEGRWLYENRYTAEPARPALLFTFYLALGHLARWTGVAVPLAYHLARVIAGAALLSAILRWARLTGLSNFGRAVALILAGMGSGLGWFVETAGLTTDPPDFWYTDAYSFASMLNFPHFTLSMALLAHALADVMEALSARQGPAIPSARAALIVFLLAWVHPRLVVTFTAVGAAASALGMIRGLWNWRRVLPSLTPAVISGAIPCVLITRSYSGDPIWAVWAATPIPPVALPWLFETYGFLWVFAALGATRLIRRPAPWRIFILAWCVVGLILPYLPVSLLAGARMIQGYAIPLGVLGAHGLAWRLFPAMRRAVRRASRKPPRPAILGALALLLALLPATSSIRMLRLGVHDALNARYPRFYSTDRAEMFRWIESNTPPDAAFLGDSMTGLTIPALTGRRTVCGHWAETHLILEKEKDIARFFDAATLPKERDAILRKLEASHVIQGMLERQLGAFEPAADPARWEILWELNGLRVFRRKP